MGPQPAISKCPRPAWWAREVTQDSEPEMMSCTANSRSRSHTLIIPRSPLAIKRPCCCCQSKTIPGPGRLGRSWRAFHEVTSSGVSSTKSFHTFITPLTVPVISSAGPSKSFKAIKGGVPIKRYETIHGRPRDSTYAIDSIYTGTESSCWAIQSLIDGGNASSSRTCWLASLFLGWRSNGHGLHSQSISKAAIGESISLWGALWQETWS